MKKYKIINTIIFIIIFITNVIYAIDFILNDKLERLGNNVILLFALLIPLILERIMKKKISAYIKTVIYIFLFLSHLLGCVVDLYRKVNWYDNFVHFLSGTLTVFPAIIFLNRSIKTKKIPKLFKLIYSIGCVLLIAIIWEIVEYIGDVLFNMDLQYQKETGVEDTMQDIIAAYLGGLFIIIPYLLESSTGIIHRLIKRIKILEPSKNNNKNINRKSK